MNPKKYLKEPNRSQHQHYRYRFVPTKKHNKGPVTKNWETSRLRTTSRGERPQRIVCCWKSHSPNPACTYARAWVIAKLRIARSFKSTPMAALGRFFSLSHSNFRLNFPWLFSSYLPSAPFHLCSYRTFSPPLSTYPFSFSPPTLSKPHARSFSQSIYIHCTRFAPSLSLPPRRTWKYTLVPIVHFSHFLLAFPSTRYLVNTVPMYALAHIYTPQRSVEYEILSPPREFDACDFFLPWRWRVAWPLVQKDEFLRGNTNKSLYGRTPRYGIERQIFNADSAHAVFEKERIYVPREQRWCSSGLPSKCKNIYKWCTLYTLMFRYIIS